ncbi:MAG: hypothetical protein CL678_17445 [Bdellovibrionaceae bacterium]|nr:hypothetical protein [Pseudobdellovibrionaceae bacterium]
MDPEKYRQRVEATEAAAKRVAAAAGSAFSICPAPTHTMTAIRSTRVRSNLEPARNPGADDSEWILTVTFEGTPESIGKKLAITHRAFKKLQPRKSLREI